MMTNLGLNPSMQASSNSPLVITISLNSTDDEFRMASFEAQIKAIDEMLENNRLTNKVLLRTVIFKEHPIKEQIQLVAESAIIIGMCGGGGVTNMFLSDGASMILYYVDINIAPQQDKRYRYPARLDWDYFNNAGSMRVHWLPFSTMDTDHDLKILQMILLNEIEMLSQYAVK